MANWHLMSIEKPMSQLMLVPTSWYHTVLSSECKMCNDYCHNIQYLLNYIFYSSPTPTWDLCLEWLAFHPWHTHKTFPHDAWVNSIVDDMQDQTMNQPSSFQQVDLRHCMDAGALQIPVDSPAKRTKISYLHLYDTGIPTGICRYSQVTCRITCKFSFKLSI